MSQPVNSRSSVLDPTEPKAGQAALPGPEAVPEAVAELSFDLSQTVTETTLQANADGLMDLLFADVNRMLERGVVPEPAPEEPVAAPVAEPLSSASLSSEPLAALNALLPPQLKLSPRDLMRQPPELFDPEPEASEQSALPVSDSPQVAPVAPQKASPLWLAALCGSLLLSAGILSFLFRHQVTDLWLGLLEQYSPSTPVAVAPSPANSSANSPAANSPAANSPAKDQPKENADFLDYLKRSIDRLARHTEASPSPSGSPVIVAISPAPLPAPNLAPNSAPNSTSPAASPRYAPVYPTAVPTAPTLTQLPVNRTPQPAAKSAPTQSGQNSGQNAPNLPAAPVPTSVPNIAAANQYTLIGVLELGERSAALFEVNGIPQRSEVGEQIGSSGWTLVSISNQEAIVRRNGEVRSIYVGQKF
jgi:hypothetical protein